MSSATYQQTNFVGGEWAPSAQGRADDPRYRTALGLMRNAVPSEQGAFVRRSGTLGIIPTRNRNYAKLLPLESTTALPYIMEFTDDSLRFIFGASPVFTNDPQPVTASSAGGGVYTFTTGSASGWASGDDLMLWLPIDYPVANEGGLRGRVLQIVSILSPTQFTVGDEEGRSNLSSGFTTDGSPLLFRIQRLTTTIAGEDTLRRLRAVPTNDAAVILQATITPKQVKIVTASSPPQDPTFSIADGVFLDGPYQAMQPDTGTVSAFSGTITFTPATSTFTADHVGRCIRLFSEPPGWVAGTTYASGALVKYGGGYWQSTQGSNVGNFPGTPVVVAGILTTFWAPAPNSQRWVWGTISAQAGTSCTVALGTDLSNQNGVPVGATNVIPSANGSSISQWQMGLWSPLVGYPSCGVFHEGRLCLSGPIGNRFDASVSDDIFVFSPTDQYGNVNDNNAISYVLNQSDTLYWMKDDDRGIIIGALKGEWLVSAPIVGDALTPTNITARRVTEYKCAQIEPVRAGSSIVFAQRYKRHLFEYLIDSFSGRFGGKPLNDMAPNFTVGEIAELAYTEEPTPIVWARMADGSLAGATYRRISRFITEAPVFNAWHGHSVGDSRVVETICGAADTGGGDTACDQLLDPNAVSEDLTGAGDRLYLVTNISGTTDRTIEVMQPAPSDGDPFAAGWFVDEAPGRGKHIVASSVAATDVFCTPIGGLRGQDGQSGATESVDLGSRATAPSGTLFSNTVGDPGRQSALSVFSRNAVWFSGYSALHNLPRAAGGSKNFLMSVWLNLVDNPKGPPIGLPSASATLSQGFIYGAKPFVGLGAQTLHNKLPAGFPYTVNVTGVSSAPDIPNGRVVKVTGPAVDSGGNQWLAPGVTKYVSIAVQNDFKDVSSTGGPFYRTWIIKPGIPSGTFFQDSNIYSLPDCFETFLGDEDIRNGAPTSPSDWNASPGAVFNDGWFHLMVSMQWQSQGTVGIPSNIDSTFSQMNLQVYLNDTQLYNGTRALGVGGGITTPYTEPADLLMAQLKEWYIGGRMPAGLHNLLPEFQSMLPADGSGLVGGMTELYINTHDFLDLTVAGNRALFHTSDVAGLTYAPVDLGLHGALPTGNKPLIYCTGGSDVFHLNRARKNAPLAVFNQYPDLAHELANIFGEPLTIDAWAGPVPA